MTDEGKTKAQLIQEVVALRQQIAELKATETEHKHAEETLRAILEGTASATGGDFFRSLVGHLAAALQVRYAFVTECTDATMTRVRTLALVEDGDLRENIEYDLAGTPCERVIRGADDYYHPRNLAEQFSKAFGKESYLGVPLYDSAGHILGHLAVMDDKPMQRGSQDTSILKIFAARAGIELERKRAEESLRESEERYRSLYNHTPVMAHSIDPDGQLVSVSDHWLRTFGYERDEVIGRRMVEFLTEASRHYAQTVALPKFFKTGYVEDVEAEFVKKNGDVMNILLSAVAERNEAGALIRSFAVLIDITERKRVEEALRQSEERFRSAFGYAPIGMALVDPEGRFLQVNRALSQILSYSEQEFRTTTFQAITHPDDLAQSLSSRDQLLAGEMSSFQIEKRYLCKHGNIIWSLLNLSLMRDSEGAPLNFIAQIQDITERKQAEEALRQSQEELRRLNQQLEDYSQNLEQKVAERTHEIERRRQVAEGLRDMLTILNSNRPLHEILDYLVAEATRLLDTQSGAVFRLQADQELFTVQTSCGLPAEYVTDLSFPLRRSFLGQAVLNRRPVVISDLAAALGEQDIGLNLQRQAILASHYHTLLAVPLLRQGGSEESDEIYGGIGLYYPTWRQFSDEEIGLAVAFADQATLAIENARLRQRVEQAAVIEERARLARELHDSVTQSLYSSTFFAEAGRQLAEAGDVAGAAQRLTRIGEIVQQALKEMRLLVYQLRPPVLEQEGLVGALRQRLDTVEKRAGVEARLLVEELVELPAPVVEGFYRIAQEALNNALKHAQATTVTVYLRSEGKGVVLEVVDNGQGFDPNKLGDTGGLGLVNMKERAEQLHGSLEINSVPGEGTSLKVTVEVS